MKSGINTEIPNPCFEISRVISASCGTSVAQNAEITRKICNAYKYMVGIGRGGGIMAYIMYTVILAIWAKLMCLSLLLTATIIGRKACHTLLMRLLDNPTITLYLTPRHVSTTVNGSPLCLPAWFNPWLKRIKALELHCVKLALDKFSINIVCCYEEKLALIHIYIVCSLQEKLVLD